MKLPCPDNLIVEHDKITGYLLNLDHRYGATKARFFIALGFSIDEWSSLADALREHGRTNDIAASRETGYGSRYAVEGELPRLLVLGPSSVRFGSSITEALLRV